MHPNPLSSAGRPARRPARALSAALAVCLAVPASLGAVTARAAAQALPVPAGASTSSSATLPSTTTTTTLPPQSTTTTTNPPSSSTTTQAPAATSTTRAPATTTTTAPAKAHGARPNVPTAGPPTTIASGPTTTTPAIDATALLNGVHDDVDQLQALSDIGPAETAVTAARQHLQAVIKEQADAGSVITASQRAHRQAQATSRAAGQRLAELAVAAYTGEANVAPVADPNGSPLTGVMGGGQPSQPTLLNAAAESAEAQVLLTAVVDQAESDVKSDRRLVSTTEATVRAAEDRARKAQAVIGRASAQVAAAQKVLADTVRAATTPGVAPPPLLASTTTPAGTTTTTSPATTPASGVIIAAPRGPKKGTATGGPTVLGPSVLTAGELAGWFASTGHTANTTVPMGQLAADYLKAGRQTGVRGDVAFAQSVVETGFFSFPSYGQVTSADNNFAGIGACDSCAAGWSFPTAQTGVSAQLQLLDAYASTAAVPTPLVGPVGVGGCCQTWMSLAGTWATNPAYGVEILTMYKQMLDWALPRRLAAAGLGPPVPASPPAPTTAAKKG